MFTIRDYLDAYRTGATSPSQAMRDVYARIARHDDPAVFINLRACEDVVGDAKVLEEKGPAGLPLYGIPIAIKDNIDVAGLPTTAACPEFAYVPARDAGVVARLRAAGAIIIGKTNLDQFATGLVGMRSPYGVPRNALNADLVPGGSSSGSAVAVAAGLVPVALGTDTAGSGRVPAALNNIVGLKPSLGAVSTAGMVAACRTLDCVSVFALDVADAWTVFEAISGFDAADPYSRDIEIARNVSPRSGLRVGVPDAASRHFGGDADSETAFDLAVADIGVLATTVRDVSLAECFAAATLLYEGAWVAERYQAIRDFIEKSPQALHPVTHGIIAKAKNFSAADAFGNLYRLAELKRAAEKIWRDIDVLMVPTYPRPRRVSDLQADPLGPNAELGTYTNFVNLLDLCALAIPSRFRTDGLPSGVTLIGPARCDAMLASIGAALHAAAGTTLGATGRVLDAATPVAEAIATDEIELVVVGAHLSGLALNHELTGRGARFVRAAETTQDYALFALPGGPPYRPGLLRIEGGTGHAIAVEVWALRPAAFATFISGIPAPLSIGTVKLSDGTAPKGFLVEAQATHGAQDISHHGGWRAFMRLSA